jgi:hypothetical protein
MPARHSCARHVVEGRLLKLRDRPPLLREFHEELAATLGLESQLGSVTEVAEVDVERSVSRAVPGAAQQVAAAREQGDVIFISDTPFPASFLRELLTRAGLRHDGDRVWSSADAVRPRRAAGCCSLLSRSRSASRRSG